VKADLTVVSVVMLDDMKVEPKVCVWADMRAALRAGKLAVVRAAD